jgi:release factor glutamine methyltransferase
VAKSPSSKALTVGELLQEGERLLAKCSESARLDSEVLLGFVLQVSRSGLLISLRDQCAQSRATEFQNLIKRRSAGEPVAYIVGEREFWGLSFKVTPVVLIPRPESELIVEQAVTFLAGLKTARLLDLGTGSGSLAISIVHELQKRGTQEVRCEAVDRSAEALHIAHENVRRHNLEQFITCVESDWCSNQAALHPPYDCIVANPPYIDPLEKTPIELSFEPHGALFSADSGLRDTALILKQATALVKPGGLLLIEVGAGKKGMLPALVEPYTERFSVSFIGDDSEADRFCVISLQAAGE